MAQGQDMSRGEVERLDRYPVARQVDRQWEARAGAVTPLDRMLVRLALARLGDPGCAVVLWDARTRILGEVGGPLVLELQGNALAHYANSIHCIDDRVHVILPEQITLDQLDHNAQSWVMLSATSSVRVG